MCSRTLLSRVALRRFGLLLPLPLPPLPNVHRSDEERLLHDFVVFFTRFEQKDPMYARWSSNVEQLTYMGFQMPQVRRNLCNLVILADPTTSAGSDAMQV